MHSHTVQGVNLNSRWMETTPESEHWLIVIIIMMKNVHRPLAGARSVFLCGDRRRSNDRGREEQSKVRDPWQRMGGCNLRWRKSRKATWPGQESVPDERWRLSRTPWSSSGWRRGRQGRWRRPPGRRAAPGSERDLSIKDEDDNNDDENVKDGKEENKK